MKSICYIVPYFGKLPKGFEMWLLSCKANPSVHWTVITDDKTAYDYPVNVKPLYYSFDEIKQRIADFYDFDVVIDRPWKLCEYKPAYGEIFAKELEGYDFWGHCDMDLVWGDIRAYITDEVLEQYEKIGFQGHSILYKNTPEVNARYRTEIPGLLSYKEAFSSTKGYCFDEPGMCDIYDALGIPYYKEPTFAHLDRFTTSFYLLYRPEEDHYKNHRQVFVWKEGKLLRYYLDMEGVVQTEEFMYIHLFSRPISFSVKEYSLDNTYAIYPDVVRNIDLKQIDTNFIQRHGTCSALHFYLKVAYFNRKKLTFKKVIDSFRKKATLAAKRGFN